MTSPALSFLLLTEDSSGNAGEVLRSLVRNVLKLVDRDTHTHRIAFDPPTENARRAMRANNWKSTSPKDEQQIRELVRATITKVLETTPPGFVVFHFDGDRPWRQAASSENLAKFNSQFINRVQQGLMSHLRDNPARAEVALKRILLVVPFYSMEAWLYQNTQEARKACVCPSDLDLLSLWEKDRSLLDEVIKPKEQLRVGDTRNLELAKHGFPATEVFELQKSFCATVQRFSSCGELLEAIRTTHCEG